MIGRGAIGKPWIFYQLKNAKEFVDEDVKLAIIKEHFLQMVEFYGEYGVVLFRKHLHTYSKGYANASVFREEINCITSKEKMLKMIEEFFAPLPA